MDYSDRLKESLFARKTLWTNHDYQYLKNVTITEWDIKSAGLSVIKFHKLLPESEINKLENMSKKMRTIREGLYQRERPDLAEKIVKTLEDVRQGFVYINGIHQENVLSIKKDAIFLINKFPQIVNIKDKFEFREKGKYTSYICLNKNEFFMQPNGDLEVKGINTECLEKQRDYFLKDISYFLKMGEKVGQNQMLSILRNYKRKYINMQLPIDTYRELDSGMFRLKDGYITNEVDESLLDDIDISQNYMNYLLPIFSLML